MIPTAAHEAAGGLAAAGTADACVQCLVQWGADPTVATILAVVAGVGVRLVAVDLGPRALAWWQRRRERRATTD